jgi:hypothetical protein
MDLYLSGSPPVSELFLFWLALFSVLSMHVAPEMALPLESKPEFPGSPATPIPRTHEPFHQSFMKTASH